MILLCLTRLIFLKLKNKSLNLFINGPVKDLTIKLCKKVLLEMQKISDKELEDAKKMIIMSLNLTLDNEERLIDNYCFKNMGLLDNLEKRIEIFKKIDTKDIVALAKKIKLISITSLGDK